MTGTINVTEDEKGVIRSFLQNNGTLREFVTYKDGRVPDEQQNYVREHQDIINTLLKTRIIGYYRGAMWVCGKYQLTALGKRVALEMENSNEIRYDSAAVSPDPNDSLLSYFIY